MHILGIETSCDETAAAVIRVAENDHILLLSNIISSQIELHNAWGGVVPNLAAREHVKNILPVIEECLKKASLSPKNIDLISVTHGPGLMPALLVGTTTAKTLAYMWKKPLLGIHHIEGHIYSNFIRKNISDIKFPILCLVVSGGHTQLVLMKKHLDYEIIGQTQDDAVGEAFDKVARILNLGYPGGPIISKLSSQATKGSSSHTMSFPRPMLHGDNLDFSFSGLKTAVLYHVKKNQEHLQDEEFIQAVCVEFQQAAIDVLIKKTIRAAILHKPKTILLAGGVSANVQLQSQLAEQIRVDFPAAEFLFPEKHFQLDNASMIATAAFFRYQEMRDKRSLFSTWKNLQTNANLRITPDQ